MSHGLSLIKAMNFTYLNEVFASELTCSQRMILVVMLNAMGRKNHCFISYETISKMAGLCEKAVRLNVAELEKMGAIARLGKRGKCNVYSVTFKVSESEFSGADFQSDSGNDYQGNNSQTPVTDSQTPVTDSQNAGNGYRQTTTEPPNNHIIPPPSKKARKGGCKKVSEADPRFVPFRNAWVETYLNAVGSTYRFHPHDGVQLSKFLKHESKMTAEEWDEFLTWLYKTMKDKGDFAPGAVKRACGSLGAACSQFNQLLILAQA